MHSLLAAVGLVAPLRALHLLRGGFAHVLRPLQVEGLPFSLSACSERDLSNFSAPSVSFKCHLVFLFDLFCLGLPWWDLSPGEGPI